MNEPYNSFTSKTVSPRFSKRKNSGMTASNINSAREASSELFQTFRKLKVRQVEQPGLNLAKNSTR